MAKQIQIYINSDDTLDEDIIEINVQNTCQMRGIITKFTQSKISAIVDLVTTQVKRSSQEILHTKKPASFGNVIHDNEF